MTFPASMTTSSTDARSDPRNANLPLVNQPATLLGTTITFLVLAILAASLRLWIRLRDHLWGWDDACVVLALIASIAGDSLVCLMPYNGLGLHFYTLNAHGQEAYFKHVWSSNVAYCASTTFIKLSILFQYMRLFAETATSTTSSQYRLARRSIWTLIIVSSMWGITFFILALTPCHPIAKSWKPLLDGKCIGWGTKKPETFFPMWAAHAATNMFLDIVVLLFPLPFLRMLRIAGKSKIGLIALFSLGGVVAIVSIGRVISLCINRAGTIPFPDMSYHTPVVYIFSVLEVNIAIFVASVPIFWPMIASFSNNKILVVNEIVVHVEQYPKTSLDGQPGIGLAEQAAFKSPPESPKPVPQQTSYLSNIARTFDRRPSRDAHRTNHRSKSSVASSLDKSLWRRRGSQDSQRNLYKTSSHDTTALSKDDYDWFAKLDRECMGTRTTTRIEKGDDPFATRRPSET